MQTRTRSNASILARFSDVNPKEFLANANYTPDELFLKYCQSNFSKTKPIIEQPLKHGIVVL